MRRVTKRLAAMMATAVFVTVSTIAPVRADDTTTIVMTFTGNGCVGCIITPQQLLNGADLSDPDSAWPNDTDPGNGPFTVGADNTVTFEVPTSRTKGMSFVIDDPSKEEPRHFVDFHTVIVFQYYGYEPGEWVTVRQARTSKKASPCWSGTEDANVAFTVNVRNQTVDGLPTNGAKKIKKVNIPLAWVSPTQEAYFGFSRSPGGVVGEQDIYPCGPAAQN